MCGGSMIGRSYFGPGVPWNAGKYAKYGPKVAGRPAPGTVPKPGTPGGPAPAGRPAPGTVPKPGTPGGPKPRLDFYS